VVPPLDGSIRLLAGRLALALLADVTCTPPAVTPAHAETVDAAGPARSAAPATPGFSGRDAGADAGASGGGHRHRASAGAAGWRCPKSRAHGDGWLPSETGDHILRAVKVGWSVERLIDHAGVPTDCTERGLSYTFGRRLGPFTSYSFRIKDGVVAKIEVHTVGCIDVE
jgi:hypothetical protein